MPSKPPVSDTSKQKLREINQQRSTAPEVAATTFESTSWKNISQRAQKLYSELQQWVSQYRSQQRDSILSQQQPLLEQYKFATAQTYLQEISCESNKQAAQEQFSNIFERYRANTLQLLEQQNYQLFMQQLQRAELTTDLQAIFDKELNRSISKLQKQIDEALKEYSFKQAMDLLTEAKLTTQAHKKLRKKIISSEEMHIKSIEQLITTYEFVNANDMIVKCQLIEQAQLLKLKTELLHVTEARISQINKLVAEFRFFEVDEIIAATQFDEETAAFLEDSITATKTAQLLLFNAALKKNDFVTSQEVLVRLDKSKEDQYYQAWQQKLKVARTTVELCFDDQQADKSLVAFKLLKTNKFPQHLHLKLERCAIDATKNNLMALLEAEKCNIRDALLIMQSPLLPQELQQQFKKEITRFQEYFNNELDLLIAAESFDSAIQLLESFVLPEEDQIRFEEKLQQAQLAVLIRLDWDNMTSLCELHCFKDALLLPYDKQIEVATQQEFKQYILRAQTQFIKDIHTQVLSTEFEDYAIITGPQEMIEDEFLVLEAPNDFVEVEHPQPHRKELAAIQSVATNGQFYNLNPKDIERLQEIEATYDVIELIPQATSPITVAGIFQQQKTTTEASGAAVSTILN